MTKSVAGSLQGPTGVIAFTRGVSDVGVFPTTEAQSQRCVSHQKCGLAASAGGQASAAVEHTA